MTRHQLTAAPRQERKRLICVCMCVCWGVNPACNCDPRGIIVMGTPCDQISGDCACKRYVTGRYCNQCLVSNNSNNNITCDN